MRDIDHRSRASRPTGLHGTHHARADRYGRASGVEPFPSCRPLVFLAGQRHFWQTTSGEFLGRAFLGHVGSFLFSAFGRVAGAHNLDQMPTGTVAQAGGARQ